MKEIIRQNYVDQLYSLKDIDIIKVLTGVRRCGKSTIMTQTIARYKEESINDSSIVYVNFEDYSSRKYLENPAIFHDEIIILAETKSNLYVFLDEVQNLPDFQRIIDSLHLRPNIDLYITGSNAYLLSNELATLFAGRYIELHVLPFSFAEYMQVHSDVTRPDALFQKYLTNGGMPGIIDIPMEQTDKYLSDIFESSVRKDMLQRNNWHKNNQLDKTMLFLFDAIGSEISINNVVNNFKSQRIPISPHTVDKYISAMLDAYLFYKVQRFDVKGKNLLKTNDKYYTVDLGFSNALLGRKTDVNLGHRLENIVYLELLRRYHKVYIGKVGDHEIDFVAVKSDGVARYFQVAYTAIDELTLARELRPLSSVRDFNQRTLLTMDIESPINYKGIERLNIIDWLLEVK